MPATEEELTEVSSIKSESDYLKEIDISKGEDGTPRRNRPSFKVLKVNEIAKIIKAINDQNYHSIIAITGKVGTGKSTLALEIAKQISILNNNHFCITKNVIYTREDFYKKVIEAKQNEAIVSDESMNLFYKREFADKEQKGLLKLLDMIRYKNLTIILCVPNFWALDTHVLNTQVRFWVHITKRKLGWIFVPSDNPFSFDPWSRSYNEMALQKHFIPKNSVNFFSGIYFNKLRKDIEQTYLKHKEKMSILSAQKEKQILYSPKEFEKKKQEIIKRRFWNTIYLMKTYDLLSQDYAKKLAKIMKRPLMGNHGSINNGGKYHYKLDDEWHKKDYKKTLEALNLSEEEETKKIEEQIKKEIEEDIKKSDELNRIKKEQIIIENKQKIEKDIKDEKESEKYGEFKDVFLKSKKSDKSNNISFQKDLSK